MNVWFGERYRSLPCVRDSDLTPSNIHVDTCFAGCLPSQLTGARQRSSRRWIFQFVRSLPAFTGGKWKCWATGSQCRASSAMRRGTGGGPPAGGGGSRPLKWRLTAVAQGKGERNNSGDVSLGEGYVWQRFRVWVAFVDLRLRKAVLAMSRKKTLSRPCLAHFILISLRQSAGLVTQRRDWWRFGRKGQSLRIRQQAPL